MGRVCTGFSLPYVAQYGATGGAIAYSNGQKLARGVSVNIATETEDANDFYADNKVGETAGGGITGGTLKLTVDGLEAEVRQFILGLPNPTSITVGTETVDVYHYGEAMNPPYVGVGYIARYMSNGVTSYVPMLVTRCRFKMFELNAETQEEDIDWQTEDIEATMTTDANGDFIYEGEAQSTEAQAEAVIKAMLDIA